MISWVQRAGAWLAPSVALAALAALIGGIHDAASVYDGALRAAVCAGFAILVAWPAGAVLSLAARVVLHVWKPRAMVAALTDEGGGAPRLAGWLLALVVGGALVAVLSHQVVWLFWRLTAFKPRTMSTALGPVMIVVVLIVVLLTRVAAAGLGTLLGRVEARWGDRRGRPLLTPRRVLAVGVGVAAIVGWLAWRFIVRPRFANVAFDGLYFPLGVLALLAAGHAAWPYLPHTRTRARAIAAVTAVALAAGLGASALWARQARPTMVLGIWGSDAFAGTAVDLFYDLYRIRDDVPIADLTPAVRPGAPRPDLLLITIDTFRPDRLELYGGPLLTPGFQALGERGTVFDWALSPSNVTRRSMPSIATGLSPPRIRGRVNGWALRMDPRHVTVAERLRAGGYHTVGLFCCDGFWERKRRLGLDRGIDDLFLRREGKDLVAAYKERLRGRAPGGPPTFTWMHFIELHEWAGGNPDMTPERRRAYDVILEQVDRWMAEISAAHEALPPERRPIVIITGDHSEAFGDHGQPFHSSDLYNSQVRVPLIVAGPGVRPARVQEPVGLADVAPTLLELGGFVAPGFPAMDGRSLADLLTGARPPDPDGGYAYATTIVDRYVRDRRGALVIGRWKIIDQLGRLELYDLRTDPGELRDLAPSKPEAFGRMRKALDERRARDHVSPFP